MVQSTRLSGPSPRKRGAQALVFVLSLLLLPSLGWSSPGDQDAPSSPPRLTGRQKRLAKKAFHRAMFWLRRSRYGKAITILENAYDRWKSPSFLYNLAVVYALKGEPVRAVEYLRRYRKLSPDEDTKLPGPLRTAKEKVGILVVRAPDPTVAIYLDGEKKGSGHIEVVLLPGRPVVELRRGQTVLKSKRVHIEGGRQTLWEVDTLPIPQRPDSGAHGGGAPRTSAPKQATSSSHATSNRKKRTKLHWAYFTAAAATAVAGFAAAAGLSARTKQIYQDFVGTDRTDRNLADQGRTYQNAANAMWAVAGTMTVAAAVLAVFTQWKHKEPTDEGLTIGPTGATLRLVW